MIESSTENNKLHIYTIFIMLYYVIAPMEDLLTGQAGTLAKYVAILIVITGVYSLGGKIKLERNTINICLLYLMGLSIISCIWATDLSTAINRNVAYLLLPGLTLFIAQLDFSERELKYIVSAAIIGGLITIGYLILIGNMQITGVQRLHLKEGNDQNGFAALMFLPFALCVGRIFGRNRLKTIGYCFLSAVFAYIILLTGSRGCLLAVLMFALSIVIFSSRNNKVKIFLGLLALLAVVYFVVMPMLPEFIMDRLFNGDSYRNVIDADENRVAFLRLAFTEILPQNLPFGVGSGCTPNWLGYYYSRDRGMHNTYVNMLCEYGLFGLPVFLLFLWNIFKREKQQKGLIWIGLLVGICSVIFFLDSYPKKFFWNVIMLLLIKEKVSGNE